MYKTVALPVALRHVDTPTAKARGIPVSSTTVIVTLPYGSSFPLMSTSVGFPRFGLSILPNVQLVCFALYADDLVFVNSGKSLILHF